MIDKCQFVVCQAHIGYEVPLLVLLLHNSSTTAQAKDVFDPVCA